jgi:hypothetical protein
MSELLKKSIQSQQTADNYCIPQKLYASAVNRYYYACLQYMLHTLFHHLTYDRNEIDRGASYNDEGSHVMYAKVIGTELGHLSDNRDFKYFNRKFPELKKLRVKADYKNEVIDDLTADDAKIWSNEIIVSLKKIKKK